MTAPSLLTLCDQLEQLRAKATPGEWRQVSWWLNALDAGKTVTTGCVQAMNHHDATLIVACVNAVPDLIAAIRAVEALIPGWEESAAWRETPASDVEAYEPHVAYAIRVMVADVRAALATVGGS